MLDIEILNGVNWKWLEMAEISKIVLIKKNKKLEETASSGLLIAIFQVCKKGFGPTDNALVVFS